MGFFGFGGETSSYREVVTDVNEDTLDRETATANLAALRKEKIAKRAGHGTTVGTTAQVVPQTKKEKKEAKDGGATIYSTQVTPTDFVPNPDEDTSTQTPDYYRNGRQQTYEKKVGDQDVIITEWAPIPQLVVDRVQPTLASIRLIDTSDTATANDKRSPGKRLIPEFSKFFLTAVHESHREKVQTVETFNDWYAFFYGEAPPVYNFSGYLLNFANYNWLNEFMYYYQNFWRGTKAVELGAKIYLTYNYQQVQGYIINVSTDVQAVTDKGAPFSIQMLVTKRKIFNGAKDDHIIRDNLLPNYGLFDTNSTATIKAQARVADFLKGVQPARNNVSINESNIAKADETVKKSAQSAKVQEPAKVDEGYMSKFKSGAVAMASSLRSGAGVLG